MESILELISSGTVLGTFTPAPGIDLGRVRVNLQRGLIRTRVVGVSPVEKHASIRKAESK